LEVFKTVEYDAEKSYRNPLHLWRSPVKPGASKGGSRVRNSSLGRRLVLQIVERRGKAQREVRLGLENPYGMLTHPRQGPFPVMPVLAADIQII
jgi:hypothetical protein